jgi:hypothetical protein
MIIHEIEKKLDIVFNEVTAFYIPKTLQGQFKEKGFIAGGCIYSLANDEEPKDYDFFITDRNFVAELVNKLRNAPDICVFSDNAISFDGGRFQIITRYIGQPDDVVGEFDFRHNMFYFAKGKVTGLVSESYLKSKRLVFNKERARDIAGVLLRVPRFVSRGMTISNSEHAFIIKTLCNNFNNNEKRILDARSTYDNRIDNVSTQQPTPFNPSPSFPPHPSAAFNIPPMSSFPASAYMPAPVPFQLPF